MTRKEFYRRLRKVAPQYDWFIQGDFIRAATWAGRACPISALAANGPLKAIEADDVAAEIGLEPEDTNAIIASADRDISCSYYDPRTRAALLRAVGLAE